MQSRNVKIIAGAAILFLVCSIGWQIGASELATVELHDDMHDMTSQLAPALGLPTASRTRIFAMRSCAKPESTISS